MIPIEYWSRSLIPREKSYSVLERKCLAVVRDLNILRAYLMYENFMFFAENAAPF